MEGRVGEVKRRDEQMMGKMKGGKRKRKMEKGRMKVRNACKHKKKTEIKYKLQNV